MTRYADYLMLFFYSLCSLAVYGDNASDRAAQFRKELEKTSPQSVLRFDVDYWKIKPGTGSTKKKGPSTSDYKKDPTITMVLQGCGPKVAELLKRAPLPISYLQIEPGSVTLEDLRGVDVQELKLNGIVPFRGDQSALQDLPLKKFTCWDWTNTTVLGNIPTLTSINIGHGTNWSRCTSIQPLSNLSHLKNLKLHGPYGPDLSPLTNLPIVELELESNKCLTDIGPLGELKLHALDLSRSNIDNVLPLKGIPLERLDISHTSVEDISALAGMPLKILDISATRITNISALAGMPLTWLSMENTKVTDLTPLKESSLEFFVFDLPSVEIGLEHIKNMDTLKSIGTKDLPVSDTTSPEKFWRGVIETDP